MHYDMNYILCTHDPIWEFFVLQKTFGTEVTYLPLMMIDLAAYWKLILWSKKLNKYFKNEYLINMASISIKDFAKLSELLNVEKQLAFSFLQFLQN